MSLESWDVYSKSGDTLLGEISLVEGGKYNFLIHRSIDPDEWNDLVSHVHVLGNIGLSDGYGIVSNIDHRNAYILLTNAGYQLTDKEISGDNNFKERKMSESLKTVYGIDLGTTFSCISYVDQAQRSQLIPSPSNNLVMPSIVCLTGDGENLDNIVVGDEAKAMASLFVDTTIQEVKRHMGDSDWFIEAFNKSYRAEQISSFILKKLVSNAAKRDHIVEDVVITVPAYFGAEARKATEQAGELAGLNVLNLIPEPTAAARGYSAEFPEFEGTLLVFDLGGGTFDVSIVEIENRKTVTKYVDGNRYLGGKQWDEQIVKHAVNVWCEEFGDDDDPLDDRETAYSLGAIAENTKVMLSGVLPSCPITVQHGVKSKRLEMSLEDFNKITKSLLDGAIDLTSNIVNKYETETQKRPSKILLVGGSTYMKQVTDALEQEFAIEIVQYDPDQIVARGAGYYADDLNCQRLVSQAWDEIMAGLENASTMTEDEKATRIKLQLEETGNVPEGRTSTDVIDGASTLMVNVCSKNFGTLPFRRGTDDRYLSLGIYMNQPVPCDIYNNFHTRFDNQTGVRFEVIEVNGHIDAGRQEDFDTTPIEFGEDGLPDLPDSCRKIGEVLLNLPDGMPAGTPIMASYSLTDDGGVLTFGAFLPEEDGSINPDYTVEAQIEFAGAISAAEMEDLKNDSTEIL